VAVHVLINHNLRPRNDSRSHDEEGRLDTRGDAGGDIGDGRKGVKIGEQFVRIKAWSVVVGMSPLPLTLALRDICPPPTASGSPPTMTRGPSSGEGGDSECVATHYIRVLRGVWDGVALEPFHPFLDFGGLVGGVRERSGHAEGTTVSVGMSRLS
jgi:hypothetical protein